MGVAYQNLIMRNKGMKRIFLSLLIGVLLIVLAGCDEKVTYSYEDLLGEWDFPGATHVSVMQSDDDPSSKKLDTQSSHMPKQLDPGMFSAFQAVA